MIPAIATAAVNNGFVVAMGIGTVFVGLVCIILLIKLMSMVTALFTANAPAAPAAPVVPTAPTAPTSPAVSTAIENRAEIVAAVCAAAAEEMGTDISALRVVSFKKIS